MKHHQITNLDKTIKELTSRLDEVHPYSSASFDNNQSNKNDGINYWKGKKIISVKDWNDIYEKSSTYTNSYKSALTSRNSLLYFPDDYNGSMSASGVVDERLREEIQNWNIDYYELLEYRKNPILGRKKCSKCLLGGSHDDPIFIGIEKVFARIVSNQCNDNVNNQSHEIITYHCNVMNIFSCPFESTKESIYPYKRNDLFTLHQISFAIEQAITTFFEITKDNEIIYEVDFVNDRVQEIHTKYNGEPESWGWQENVKEQLSKVKQISNIVIRDEQDIYNILTNREKLKDLLQEYEKEINHQLSKEKLQVCCDENITYVPNKENEKVNNSNEKKMNVDTGNYNNDNYVDSHKGENHHSKKLKEQEELEKSHREQVTLLKNYKQTIISFLLVNKDSIRVEDLKIYEPIYQCYREKSLCLYCNKLSNIFCDNCNGNVCLCVNHWQNHKIEKH